MLGPPIQTEGIRDEAKWDYRPFCGIEDGIK